MKNAQDTALAQAAKALLTAEAALMEAEVRVRQAELDRLAALREIAERQREINSAIADLQRSGARALNIGDVDGREKPLILQPEDQIQDPGEPLRPSLKSVAAEFGKLEALSSASRRSTDT